LTIGIGHQQVHLSLANSRQAQGIAAHCKQPIRNRSNSSKVYRKCLLVIFADRFEILQESIDLGQFFEAWNFGGLATRWARQKQGGHQAQHNSKTY